MHPIFRFLIRITVIFVIGFFLIQPYNWYCNIIGDCRPLLIKRLIPKKEGTQSFDIYLEVNNYNEFLDFESEHPSIETVINRKNIVNYKIRNNSDKVMIFRPKLQIEPPAAKEFIEFYDCLCFHEFRLKKNEEKTISMEFLVNPDIQEELFFHDILNSAGLPDQNTKIRIRYAISQVR